MMNQGSIGSRPGRRSSLLAALTAAALFPGLHGSVSAAETKTSPPDLTGIWTNYRGEGAGRSNVGEVWPSDPPFTAEARKKVEEYQRLVSPTGDTPGGFCLGSGMPASMLGSGGYPMEIIQRPEQITIIYEAHTEIRRIYMDGREVDPDDIIPSRNGFSTGRWEGDTLVVETTALKEQVDQVGGRGAHSDQAKIVERYTLGREGDTKVLTAELTLTDPVFYTKPVTATKKWRELQDGRMMLYECNEPAWEDHIEQLRQQAAGGKAEQPSS